MPYAMIYLIT